MTEIHNYNQFAKIVNLCNDEVYLKAHSIVKANGIKLCTFNEHDNSYVYHVTDKNSDVILWYVNETLLRAKCSCHDYYVNFDSDNLHIDCEVLLSVVLFHTFVDDDNILREKYFQSDLQKSTLKLLRKNKLSRLPVLNNKELVGIVSERDIAKKLGIK